jgi:hypothetical protein
MEIIDHIVEVYGEERFTEEIRDQLIAGTYHPLPARRKKYRSQTENSVPSVSPLYASA